MHKTKNVNATLDTKYYTLSITTMRTVLGCDADRHKFGIYIFPKGKDWRTAGDELLYGYTNAFCLGTNDKNEHIQQIQPYIFCGTINDMKSKEEFVICKNCKEARNTKNVFDSLIKMKISNNYRKRKL